MATKTKIGSDVTLGIALGVIAQAIFKSLDIEVDDAMAPAIGVALLALLTRLGIKLKESKNNFRSRDNPDGKMP